MTGRYHRLSAIVINSLLDGQYNRRNSISSGPKFGRQRSYESYRLQELLLPPLTNYRPSAPIPRSTRFIKPNNFRSVLVHRYRTITLAIQVDNLALKARLALDTG